MTLTEIGTAYAGREFTSEVGSGECVRIMTGAVLPKNTDTVVIREAVNVDASVSPFPKAGTRTERRFAAKLQKGSPRSGRADAAPRRYRTDRFAASAR